MYLGTKNLSYKQLAAIMAVAIAIFGGLLVWVTSSKWYYGFFALFAFFLFTFYLLSFLLDRFINRKIKVIYKLISKEKASIKIEGENFDKTIDEVKEDVEKWAVEKRGEIVRLQNNESFRKEFLMNLAHELRTPIFAIQGYISTLLDGEIENPEVNVRFLENASRSTDRLSALVDDLREISHYESQQIRLEKNAFSIQKLVKKVFVELQPLAEEKNISLSIKKGCEGDFFVWADAVRIEQVLNNLVQNAIKYGHQDGHVLAGIYLVGKKEILIEIADNGMGMKPDQSIRAFERFFRTDEARAVDKLGNGLGLAIVKHIIEAHEHTISCRSEIGLGTTFSFTLDRDQD